MTLLIEYNFVVTNIDCLLITGGSGFVGQSLLDYLSELTQEELPTNIGLTTRGSALRIPNSLVEKINVEQFSSDLREPWEFKFPATHIINLAADGSSNAYSPSAAHDFGLITKHLANWCRTLDTPTVFQASSGVCFGHYPIMPQQSSIHNREEGFPKNSVLSNKKKAFLESRIAAEEALKCLEQDTIIRLRIGRLFSFVGKHLRQKPHYALSAFVNMAETNKNIEIMGNPLTVRSYLSSKDMAMWIYRALDPYLDSSVLSIGSTFPVTMIELAKFIAKLSHSKITLLNPEADGDIYVANNQDTCERLQVIESQSWQNLVIDYIGSNRK